MAAPKASFQATLNDIDAVLEELSAGGLEVVAAPFVEAWVDDTSAVARLAVRDAAPIGRGRLSQWQRKGGKGHGSFKKTVSRSFKRGGIDSAARIRVGPIGNILRSGAKAHLIKAPAGHRLVVGLAFPTFVRHPGSRPNDFWDRAVDGLDAKVEPLTRKAGFGTVDKMAANIEKRSRRR
jgi:hypothetical protein